jgi:DNA-binding protein Fis
MRELDFILLSTLIKKLSTKGYGSRAFFIFGKNQNTWKKKLKTLKNRKIQKRK